MSLQYDDKLADLLINGGLRASKEGRQTIDAGALLREAGEAASLPAPEPLEEGDIKCSPVLTEEIKECLEEAVNASSSGMAGVDDFLIALCGSAKIPDASFTGAGTERNALLKVLMERKEQEEMKKDRHRAADSIIGQNGRDLTALAKSGAIRMPFKRDKECREALNILAKMEKGNPVLIGEAGTGKTAIAEGIACLVSSGNAPRMLKNARVVEIRAAAFSNAYRTNTGPEFIRRLEKEMLSDDAGGQMTILFVDELHVLLENSAMSEFLKPSLARTGFRMIGATTNAEYRRYVEKNKAFERRFTPVHVNEFAPEDALEVLKARLPRYENYHSVTIAPEAAEAAVNLSCRYIPEKRLPDKAIDLIDTACAEVSEGRVEAEHVKRALSSMAQIPVAAIYNSFAETCQKLPALLRRRIKGQGQAIEKVCRLLMCSAYGLGNGDDRPLGSFLLAGPTGTGKTEFGKALAESFFGPKSKMVRLDMSEYSQPNSVSALIGSPPGYVDSDRGGVLTEAINRNPFTLVLVDEIEKAAPEVIKLFLQILDEGRITDSMGRLADFRNALLVFTTNAGVPVSSRSLGFASSDEGDKEDKDPGDKALYAVFPSEFLGRFDGLIHFNPLNTNTLMRIIALELSQKRKRLATLGVDLRFEKGVLPALADMAKGNLQGARCVSSLIMDRIYYPAAVLLSEGVRGKITAAFDGKGKKITVTPASTEKGREIWRRAL